MRWIALLSIGLASGACAAPLERFEYARPAMGTEFRIVLHAGERARADAAAGEAFARIAELDRALSDYDPESELSRLGARSDAGPTGPLEVSADLWRVLALAQEIARESGGAFDATVGPLSRLWRRARRQRELPEPARIAEALRAVGYEKLELEPGRVRLLAPLMRLDLGGIAKGYALDEALVVLARRGLTRALVVGGGELRAGDPPPGARGWRVELVGLEEPAERLELAGAALATSGDLEQYVELGGVRHSHILDPRTGQALTERRLVSVIGPAAVLTDALATAASVLGPAEGLALVARHPGYEARILVRSGERTEVFSSAGFRSPLSCGGRSNSSDP